MHFVDAKAAASKRLLEFLEASKYYRPGRLLALLPGEGKSTLVHGASK